MAEIRDNIEIHEKGVRKALGRIEEGTVKIQLRSAAKASDPIWKHSQHIVPVETGALKKSGKKTIEYTKDTALVTMSYGFSGAKRRYTPTSGGKLVTGRDPSKYAAIVHEMTGPFKNPSKPNTQPKYLEQPIADGKAKFFRVLGNTIKYELQQLVKQSGGS